MKLENYLPLGDQLVVDDPVVLEQKKHKKKTSGIIITDEVLRSQLSKEQKTVFVTVHAVGNKVTDVKVGDRILFSGSSSVVALEGADGVTCDHLQIREFQILGRAIPKGEKK